MNSVTQNKELLNKIAIGTVQFGLNYGISNVLGQPDVKECSDIIEFAQLNNIDTIDTASLYGESESVLGQLNVESWKVVSKYPKVTNSVQLLECFESSLSKLKVKKLYGYLAHDSSTLVQEPKLWDVLIEKKQKGEISQLGISIYTREQLEKVMEQGMIPDLVQIPYNVFDRRFEDLFSELKSKEIEIHTRSTFLQGLLFMSPNEIDPYFLSIVPKLNYLKNEYTSLKDLAGALLLFSLQNKFIDKVVVGVNSLYELRSNIEGVLHCRKPILKDLAEKDEAILFPYNWPT